MRKFVLPSGCRCIVDAAGNRITFASSEVATSDPEQISLLEKMVKAGNAQEVKIPVPVPSKPA